MSREINIITCKGNKYCKYESLLSQSQSKLPMGNIVKPMDFQRKSSTMYQKSMGDIVRSASSRTNQFGAMMSYLLSKKVGAKIVFSGYYIETNSMGDILEEQKNRTHQF